MSIVARIRPSVEVKAHRVTKPRAIEFAAGILATAAPCPIATADAAIKEGRASRVPSVNGRGLTAAESMRMNEARSQAWFDAEHSATGSDLEVAEAVGVACEAATARELRLILADRPRPWPRASTTVSGSTTRARRNRPGSPPKAPPG